MVIADFSGEFLNIESSKDGDIAVIIDKSVYSEREFDNKKKTVLEIPIELNKKKMTYTPGMKAGRTLVKAWGKETDNWRGKKFTIFHIDGVMVIRPIIEEKA